VSEIPKNEVRGEFQPLFDWLAETAMSRSRKKGTEKGDRQEKGDIINIEKGT
jgi:hypothetical protein